MDSEKRRTQEWFGGFFVRWDVEDHWADVTAWESAGRYEDGTHVFALKDWRALPADVTRNVDEAEVYLDGFIKWDGCTELDMGKPHWCGPDGYIAHIELLRYLYRRAYELMGREPWLPWKETPETSNSGV
jgi:hypothetical protein